MVLFPEASQCIASIQWLHFLSPEHPVLRLPSRELNAEEIYYSKLFCHSLLHARFQNLFVNMPVCLSLLLIRFLIFYPISRQTDGQSNPCEQ